MNEGLPDKVQVRPMSKDPWRSALCKMAGLMALAVLLVFSGCARSVTTTTTRTSAAAAKLTTTSSPAATSTTTAKPTTTTTSTPTTPTGPYGQLKIAVTNFSQESFEPPVVDLDGAALTHPLFDSMFWMEKGEVKPGIVEKWQMAADALSWIYSIRKGVKFHNGDNVTAADVKFSIEQYLRKEVIQPNTRQMVDRIDLLDDYTLRVYTKGKQPYLPYMESLPTPQQGAVMPKGYIEGKGWEVARVSPVGSGPWKFVRHNKGDSVEYEAQSSHWRQTPSFKNLTVILMPEETTRLAAIRTSELDIGETTVDNVPTLEAAGVRTITTDFTGIVHQLFGAYDPRAKGTAIADVRVRKALALSIDRDAIRKDFFKGKGGSPMPEQMTQGTPEIDPEYWEKYYASFYKYDPAAAKKLLADAGYANGFPIKLYAFQLSGGAFLPKISEITADYWQKIGVRAQVVNIEWTVIAPWRVPLSAQLLGQVFALRMLSGRMAPGGLEAAYASWGSTQLLSKAFPEVDKMITDIYNETDPAKRKQMIADTIKFTDDLFVAIPVAQAPLLLGLGPKVDAGGWVLPLSTSAYSTYAAAVKHR
ncbi:MAG: ABC transporter substrate-binding protein [Chloroflexi bacterium]|nr:ABC transporter substrate-binding protein [Chloroflexota bacterium]